MLELSIACPVPHCRPDPQKMNTNSDTYHIFTTCSTLDLPFDRAVLSCLRSQWKSILCSTLSSWLLIVTQYLQFLWQWVLTMSSSRCLVLLILCWSSKPTATWRSWDPWAPTASLEESAQHRRSTTISTETRCWSEPLKLTPCHQCSRRAD